MRAARERRKEGGREEASQGETERKNCNSAVLMRGPRGGHARRVRKKAAASRGVREEGVSTDRGLVRAVVVCGGAG